MRAVLLICLKPAFVFSTRNEMRLYAFQHSKTTGRNWPNSESSPPRPYILSYLQSMTITLWSADPTLQGLNLTLTFKN